MFMHVFFTKNKIWHFQGLKEARKGGGFESSYSSKMDKGLFQKKKRNGIFHQAGWVVPRCPDFPLKMATVWQ